MTTRSWFLSTLILASVAGLVLTVSAGSSGGPDPTATAARPVKVESIQPAPAPTLHFPGTTRAVRRAAAGFLDGGRLVSRPVEAGSRVEPGDVLARVDSRDRANAVDALAARLQEVEARHRHARLERDRVRTLHDDGAATSEELDAVVAASEALDASIRVVEAELQEARRRVFEATLRAPWQATVVEVLAEPGDIVAPGQPVIMLAGEGAIEIEIRVPDGLVDDLQEGQPVRIVPTLARSEARTGTLANVSRNAAGSGLLFPVLVRPTGTEPLLPTGIAVDVEIATAGDQAEFTVPLAAVRRSRGDHARLVTVADGAAKEIEIRTGRLLGERIEVFGALETGQRVVVAGPRDLQPGDPVEVLP